MALIIIVRCNKTVQFGDIQLCLNIQKSYWPKKVSLWSKRSLLRLTFSLPGKTFHFTLLEPVFNKTIRSQRVGKTKLKILWNKKEWLARTSSRLGDLTIRLLFINRRVTHNRHRIYSEAQSPTTDKALPKSAQTDCWALAKPPRSRWAPGNHSSSCMKTSDRCF